MQHDENALDKIQSRGSRIVKTSIVGIVANVGLAAIKAVIGMLTGSVAITLDALNNISDAASSVITIIGAKLAAKPSDRKHPFGYGRVEYLSSLIISLLVVYAGVSAFVESAKAILNPTTPSYTGVALGLVAAGVVVKVLLGRYVVAQGTKLSSESLVNSGKDALLDAIVSASTLVTALIYIYSNLTLEAWLGAIIAIIIIKSGIEMLRDALSEILGERANPQLADDIKQVVNQFPEVRGAYDLVLNDYGPDTYYGSLHIEVVDTMDADHIDELTRKITSQVASSCNVILTAISVYSYNTTNDRIQEIRTTIAHELEKYPDVLEMHGFYVDFSQSMIRFDVVISLEVCNREELYDQICKNVQALFPDYKLLTALDTDFAEPRKSKIKAMKSHG
ncbi:MAG: cation diffusion facilitator family transporter [Atopobiaceae bacterium]